MKYNKTILFLAFFCAIFDLIGQSNFSDYSYSDKEDLFYDSFNDNSNYWMIGEKTYGIGKIASGYYNWTAKSNYTATTTQNVKIDTERDFQIETRFTRLSGENKSTLQSLLWGCASSKKNYFGFTADGSFRISWYDGSKYHAYKDWATSTSLNKNTYNKLTIRKVGKKMYFFINETRVYSMSFKPFFGDNIGFQAPKTAALKIAYIRVSYLKKMKKNYDSYSSKDKVEIFNDNFNDNSNNWKTGSSESTYGYISNGYYTWKSKQQTSAWSTQKTIKIDQSKDFEIEARLKYLEGKKTSGIMLRWGKSDDEDFNFEFTASGKYWIGEYVNNGYVKSKGWTSSSYINNTSYNKLTIRKISDKYYFFINGKYVHSMPFKKFYGDRIAFTSPANSSIKIDYLTASYLQNGNSLEKYDNLEDPTGGY